MEYSFVKTLIKVLKNLGIIGLLAALNAMSENVGDVSAELGAFAPLFALGVQMAFSFLVDYLQHRNG